MSPENEPTVADGARKAEEKAMNDIDAQYAELLKKDQDAMEAKIRGETANEFDKVRKLGFATNKDIEENIKAYYGKIVEENKALRDEFTKLREWVMRVKATGGLNSGALDGALNKEDDAMKKFRPKW